MIEIYRRKEKSIYPESLGSILVSFPSDPILSPIDMSFGYFYSSRNDLVSLTRAYEHQINTMVIPKKEKMLRYYLMVNLPIVKIPTLRTIRKLILRNDRYTLCLVKGKGYNPKDHSLRPEEFMKKVINSPGFTAYDVLNELWRNTPLGHTSCSDNILHLMLCDYGGENDFKTGLNSYKCNE